MTTRAQIEQILVNRAGSLMTKIGFATTVAGSNSDLEDPLGWAIRQAGGSVSSLVSVDDDDVATVGDSDLDKLLDLGEYRLLKNIAGNLDLVDLRVGEHSEAFSDLHKHLEYLIKEKEKQLEQEYGFGVGTLQAGVIDLDFIQKDDLNE